MSRYELWDQASGNILGDFDTEAEAQALASDFIAATGSADRFVVIPVNSEAEQALAWALHLADPATTDTGAHTPMCEDRAARILAALSASGYTITETERVARLESRSARRPARCGRPSCGLVLLLRKGAEP